MMIRHSNSEFAPELPPQRPDTARRARRIYNGTFVGVYLSFVIGGPMLAMSLPHEPGHALPGWYFAFCYLYLMLSQGAATWVCRRAGVSQESRRSENIQRDPRAALAPFLSDAPALSVAIGRGRGWVRVNREGIEANGRKRVLWRDVERCTFNSARNASGRSVSSVLTLRDLNGKVLLSLSPTTEQADELLGAARFYLRGEGANLGPGQEPETEGGYEGAA